MPIYEYKCQECGHVEEHLMKLSDPPPAQCVKCKGAKLEKLMSQTSFALKGSGWYVTDYKAKPPTKGDSEAGAAAAAVAAPAAGEPALAVTPDGGAASSGGAAAPSEPAAKPPTSAGAE